MKTYEDRMADVDQILGAVRHEIERAVKKHGPMHSPHEGYSVILEELDELWDHVKHDTARGGAAMKEALQIAAMGVRYIADLTPEPDSLAWLHPRRDGNPVLA